MYLKPNIKMEPLVCGWYAWPYLIPPLTLACHMSESYIKIMQSYIKNPEIHDAAVKDPSLLGGPFVDLEASSVPEVENLLRYTLEEYPSFSILNEDIKKLDLLLQSECVGDSLEELYAKIPQSLRGLLELVYDLNSNPSFRIIEPLFYKKYYSSKIQSVALSEMVTDKRSFILSTPRIRREDELHINIPFADPAIDLLFKTRVHSGDFNEIQRALGISAKDIDLFRSFFSEEQNILPLERNYNGGGVRIRYFGHACVLVETKSTSILFDPIISYFQPNGSSVSRYTFDDLPDHIDYVVLTHNHQDHIVFETLLQIRHKIGQVVFPLNNSGTLHDPSIKLLLEHIGFNSLIELKELDRLPLNEGEMIALPFLGEHANLNIHSKLSYALKIGGVSIVFAADSNNPDPYMYDHILDIIGPVDMLFIGMECDGAPLSWLYGSLLTKPLSRTQDHNRNLSGSNFEQAWSIVERLKCKEAYVYAMGQEPWLGFMMALEYTKDSIQITESNKFVEMCKSKGIESERLYGKKEWIKSKDF